MLRELRANLILYLLVLYPIVCFGIRTITGSVPNYVTGVFFIGLTLDLLFEKYAENEALKLPLYVRLFGLFALYVFFSGVFVSDIAIEEGFFKYFYRDPYIRTFAVLLLIENTHFPRKLVKSFLPILYITLIIAAITSVIQVVNPFFLLDRTVLYDESLATGGNVSDLNPGNLSGAAVRILLQGYRFSIYSWSGSLSVGFDSIAILSILLGTIGLRNERSSIILVICGALIAFLSSSRWIMLNFLIVSSQIVFAKSNVLLNLVKYIVVISFVGLVFILLVSYLGIDLQGFIENRLKSATVATRVYSAEVFGKVFPLNPIFGTGGVTTKEVQELIAGITSQIHVGWLKIFFYYGYLGGAIWVSALINLLYTLRKRAKMIQSWGPYLAILAFGIANLTLVNHYLFYHGLLLAIVFSKYKHKDDTTGSEEVLEPFQSDKTRVRKAIQIH